MAGRKLDDICTIDRDRRVAWRQRIAESLPLVHGKKQDYAHTIKQALRKQYVAATSSSGVLAKVVERPLVRPNVSAGNRIDQTTWRRSPVRLVDAEKG